MSTMGSLRRRARRTTKVVLKPHRPKPAIKTYWNGEPAVVRKLIIKVGTVPKPGWWCAGMEKTRRKAIEVTQGGQTFLLDDENNSAWLKVTEGMGSPQWGHRTLPDDSEIIEERP